jgi:hypothetical protein
MAGRSEVEVIVSSELPTIRPDSSDLASSQLPDGAYPEYSSSGVCAFARNFASLNNVKADSISNEEL